MKKCRSPELQSGEHQDVHDLIPPLMCPLFDMPVITADKTFGGVFSEPRRPDRQWPPFSVAPAAGSGSADEIRRAMARP